MSESLLLLRHQPDEFSQSLFLFAHQTPPVIQLLSGAIPKYVPHDNLLVAIEQKFKIAVA
jgi:hypothetical protein